MGTYQNSIQRTEIRIMAMVRALRNGALDALICMSIHHETLLSGRIGLLFRAQPEIFPKKPKKS